ncbi:MAG: hypothetical protein IKR39_11885 [Lachnospiraceae bacterium]|nr:hypothetical protein [Lachnospiraceae bacterium]
MEDYTLIRKVNMSCPICENTHEVEERKQTATIILDGKKVTYEERFYFCSNADEDENEFENGAMVNENLRNARNAALREGIKRNYIPVSLAKEMKEVLNGNFNKG